MISRFKIFLRRFFIIDIKKCKKFSKKDKIYVNRLLRRCTIPYEIDLKKVTYRWASTEMLKGNKEAFSVVNNFKYPNTIFIQKIKDPRKKRGKKLPLELLKEAEKIYKKDLKMCIPILVHGLCHLGQYKKYTLIPYCFICGIPYFYNKILDREAYNYELEAAENLNLDKNLFGPPIS